MKKASANELKRGQTISFRIPSDAPDHLIKQLSKLKETERRNFSSKMAEFVLEGASQSLSREREMISVPLPKQLTKAQRDWLKHEHSEALLGSIIYHLITDPVRATSLLASLNSPSKDMSKTLYLQEEVLEENGFAEIAASREEEFESVDGVEEVEIEIPPDMLDDMMDDDFDDLAALSLDHIEKEEPKEEITDDMDIDDILGDFLASMNK